MTTYLKNLVETSMLSMRYLEEIDIVGKEMAMFLQCTRNKMRELEIKLNDTKTVLNQSLVKDKVVRSKKIQLVSSFSDNFYFF